MSATTTSSSPRPRQGVLPSRWTRRTTVRLPVYVGFDHETEGNPAHDRRVSDGRQRDPPLCVRPAPERTSSGARPTSAGDRALLPRLRASPRQRHLDRRAKALGLSAKGSGGSSSSVYRRRSSAPRRTRDPRLHRMRREHPESLRPVVAAAAGVGRRADRPKAWLWYLRVIGSERCQIVDTWWQTRRRVDHDHAAAPGSSRPNRGRRRGRSRDRGRRGRRARRQAGRRGPGSAGSDQAVAVDALRCTATTSSSSIRTSSGSPTARRTWSATRPVGTRTATTG